MRKFALLVLTGAFILFFAFIIVSADARSMPSLIKSLYAFPGGDKVGHVVLMGALSLLVNAAVAASSSVNTARRMVVATLVISAVIAAEEFSQQFFPNRTPSWEDLACSLIGIWLVGFGGVMLWQRVSARRLA
jgi:VanZ family protein